MIRIITVAREYGSGGAEIGHRVADALGWRFIDRWVIENAARLARVSTSAAQEYDERAESWMERMIAGVRAPSPEIYATAAPSSVFDANAMHRLTEHAIRSAADESECVIIGRGSQWILRDRSDALHVFVYAPIETRMQRLQRRFPHEKHIRELMSDVDQERASYVHRHYRCDWDDRHLYDLCINSALGTGPAASIIQTAANLAYRGQQVQL